jgi:hypothetical protein
MDTPLQTPLDVPDYPTEHLLYGDDPLQGVVAVVITGSGPVAFAIFRPFVR